MATLFRTDCVKRHSSKTQQTNGCLGDYCPWTYYTTMEVKVSMWLYHVTNIINKWKHACLSGEDAIKYLSIVSEIVFWESQWHNKFWYLNHINIL